ncbi:MAG TPA: MFS transporter [Vicinamibacterales bacterium]|jgi:putative MFS transporter
MPGTLTAAERLDRLAVSAFHRRTAALLAYVFFFELGDLNSFAYAAPALRQQWQLSLQTIATITSASFVGMFVGAMSAGTLSDHVGRKRALILTTVWYSSMSLLNACAWNVPSLFAARLLTGVGLSGMTVVAMTYIGEIFPSRVRGAFQARVLMFGLIGIPATAYVARFAVPQADWGWRVVFVWGALAIFFPFFARRLEESPRWLERRGRVDEAERVLARIEEESPIAEASLVPSGGSVQARHVGESIGIKGLLRSGFGGRALLLVGVWFCQTLGFYGFNAWVPTLLAEQGFSIIRTLEQSSAISIGAVPGAWVASKIADRWERKYLIAGVAVLVGTFGMIYGLSFNTWVIVIFGFLVAMSQQVFAPMLYAYTAECFPTNARNTGAGLSYGIGRLGNAVGPLIVAFLFMTYGYRSVFAYIAVCWVLVAILILAFGPRMNQRTLA